MNQLRSEEGRRWALEQLFSLAERCDGLRVDMAMLCVNEVVERSILDVAKTCVIVLAGLSQICIIECPNAALNGTAALFERSNVIGRRSPHWEGSVLSK